MVQVEGGAAFGASRPGVLQAGIVADAERLRVPVSLSVLCVNAAALLRVAGVAVSVAAAGVGADTLAASDRLARVGEELQVTVGQGPSLEVLSGFGPLLVADLAQPQVQARWPLFAPAAAQAGIASLYVVPMRLGAARFGILAVYLDVPGGLAPAGLSDAVRFASLALELLMEQLQASLTGIGGVDDGSGSGRGFGADKTFDDRPEIHHATGMISVQLEVDLATALLRLRARAFTDGRLLSDLAADVVARTIRFTAPDEQDNFDPAR